LVSIAITIAFLNVCTAARVNLTWTVAHATRIERAHAIVDVIAQAVQIVVRCAFATTHANRVELIAVAVTVAGRNVKTSTIVDVT